MYSGDQIQGLMNSSKLFTTELCPSPITLFPNYLLTMHLGQSTLADFDMLWTKSHQPDSPTKDFSLRVSPVGGPAQVESILG